MSVENGGVKSDYIDSKDRDGFVALLGEYSEKLSLTCQKIEISGDKYVGKIVINVLLLFIIFGFQYYVFGYPIDLMRNDFYFLRDYPLFTFTSLLLGAITSMFSIARDLQSYTRHKNSLIRDAKSIHKKLEKIIQIVSQIQEHSEDNRFARMNMDLRLTDAESVIEDYIYLVVKKPDFASEILKAIASRFW